MVVVPLSGTNLSLYKCKSKVLTLILPNKVPATSWIGNLSLFWSSIYSNTIPEKVGIEQLNSNSLLFWLATNSIQFNYYCFLIQFTLDWITLPFSSYLLIYTKNMLKSSFVWYPCVVPQEHKQQTKMFLSIIQYWSTLV